MKLEWIDCFVKIVETGSINKVAEKLYVSQPGAMISVGFSKKAEMHVENCFEKLNINKTHRIS